jgi:hypothetical protein
MRISSFFRQIMALLAVGTSVFVVTGCQGEDKPAPLPNIPSATTTPTASNKTSPTTGKAAASAAAGARQPRFGEPAAPSK